METSTENNDTDVCPKGDLPIDSSALAISAEAEELAELFATMWNKDAPKDKILEMLKKHPTQEEDEDYENQDFIEMMKFVDKHRSRYRERRMDQVRAARGAISQADRARAISQQLERSVDDVDNQFKDDNIPTENPLELALVTFRETLPEAASLLQAGKDDAVMTVLDKLPSINQKRRLLGMLAATIVQIFTLFTNFLLRNDNTSTVHGHALLRNPSTRHGLATAIALFDTNWLILKDDPRVYGEPEHGYGEVCDKADKILMKKIAVGKAKGKQYIPKDTDYDCICSRAKPALWVSLVQARALLALALGRASLAATRDTFVGRLTSVEQDHSSKTELELTRNHLDMARDMQRWTYVNQQRCESSVKDLIEVWRFGSFFPLLQVIEDGLSMWESHDLDEALCRHPSDLTVADLRGFKRDVLIGAIYTGTRMRRLVKKKSTKAKEQEKTKRDFQGVDMTIELEYGAALSLLHQDLSGDQCPDMLGNPE